VIAVRTRNEGKKNSLPTIEISIFGMIAVKPVLELFCLKRKFEERNACVS